MANNTQLDETTTSGTSYINNVKPLIGFQKEKMQETTRTEEAAPVGAPLTVPYGPRRLFLYAGRYYNFVTLILFAVGLGWFLLWPILSKKTYYSENALSVFFQTPEYNQVDANFAVELSKELHSLNRSALDFREQVYERVSSVLNSQQPTFYSEIKRHVYVLDRNYLNKVTQVKGENLYVTFRSRRGNGKESIVLTVPYFKLDSVAFSMSILKVISRMGWLNHDIILAVCDGYEQNWSGEEAFISSTVIPTGRMREAITIDFDHFNFNQVAVLTEGINGELPNLDMVNVVQGLMNEGYYNFGKNDLGSFFKSDTSATSNIDETIKKNPNFKDHLPAFVYLYHKLLHYINKMAGQELIPNGFIHKSETVMHHWYNQLLSVPTGAHSWFRNQLIHALTLTNSVPRAESGQTLQNNFYMMGRLVESTLRSLNNLIEELHQSFFLYYVDSTSTYYGFEHYLPNLLIFFGALVLQFIGNYYAEPSNGKDLLQSALFVVLSYFTGILIYLCPIFIRDITTHFEKTLSQDSFITCWFSIVLTLVCFMLLVIYPIVKIIYRNIFGEKSKGLYWRYVKSLSIAAFALIMGAVLIYSSALAILASVYMLIMSAIVTVLPTNIVLRGLQFIALLAMSPFNLIVLNTLVRREVFGESIQDQLDYLFSITDLNNNLFYIVFCIAMIPSWTVFICISLFSRSAKEKQE